MGKSTAYWVLFATLWFAPAVSAATTTSPPVVTRGLPDFTELVERQGAAVVNISTTQTVRARRPQNLPFDENDPAFELFRRFIPRPPGGNSVPRDLESHSLGSGFIISTDGYILTNAHVIEAAESVAVRLSDRREFRARVIGIDKRTDVALIKIDGHGLPVVRIGNPGALKVGEWVVAIGSPFGFENSVTAGIVSAKGRNLPQEDFVPFIQADVAVNPGNSGGPLFNLRGEVVGINSQIYSRTGGFMGLSFAIPIDIALEVQAQLRTTGRVRRGRIGVIIQELTNELAESFGLAKAGGALVSSIEAGGPAERAGIEVGDVVLKFDGRPVVQSSDLPRLVGAAKPGSAVPLQLWRKGGHKEILVVIGEIPEERAARPSPSPRQGEQAANRLGLVVSELSPEQRRELRLNRGLVVEDIRGNASRSELRPGDVIVAMIDRGMSTEIESVEQFNALLAQVDKHKNITLLVRRGDAQTFVVIYGVAHP